jgi:hypothetical protein
MISMLTPKRSTLAMVAICLSTVTASTAVAAEFVAKSGKVTLKGNSVGAQVITTDVGPLGCSKASLEAPVKVEKFTTTIAKLKYSGCTVDGVSATVSEAEIELNADEKPSIINTVSMKAGGCELVLGPEGNKALIASRLGDLTKGVEIEMYLEGMTYKPNTKACGESGKNAEYKGTFEVGLEGGVFSVQGQQNVAYNPTSLPFGNQAVFTSSPSMSVVITGPVRVGSSRITNRYFNWVAGRSCTAAVLPCTALIFFSPEVVGPTTGQFSVVGPGTASVALSGTGT